MMSSRSFGSPLESRLFDSFLKFDIRPKLQYPIDVFFADFSFPDKKLVVEVDGFEHHIHRSREDKYRDMRMNQEGWTVIRYPGWFVHRYPDAVVAEIALRYLKDDRKDLWTGILANYFVKSGQTEISDKLFDKIAEKNDYITK